MSRRWWAVERMGDDEALGRYGHDRQSKRVGVGESARAVRGEYLAILFGRTQRESACS